MWSQKPPEAVSEILKLKIFLGGGGGGGGGGACPQIPLVWACYARCDSITMDCIPPWEKNPVKGLSSTCWYIATAMEMRHLCQYDNKTGTGNLALLKGET